jgi:hypothetical protein
MPNRLGQLRSEVFWQTSKVGIDMIFADIATWKHSCLQHAQNTTQEIKLRPMFVRQRRSNGVGALATLPIISPESFLPPEGQTRHRRILASSVLLIDRSYFIGWVVIVALSIFVVSLVWRPILAFFALKAQSVRHYNHQGEQDASAGSSLPLSKFSELSHALKNSDLVALFRCIVVPNVNADFPCVRHSFW